MCIRDRAEDSGLSVDALKGRPGVYSARYAGVHGEDEANNDKVLSELEGVSSDRRGAQFNCYLCLANPQGQVILEGLGDLSRPHCGRTQWWWRFRL